MLANCSGNAGANSWAMVVPSGWTSARYSPPVVKLKLACKGAPGTARFLPEAKTIRNPFGERFVEGMRHLVRFPAESVRNQPSIFTLVVPELKISIQSGVSLSSSRKPPLLEARNSEMKTVSADNAGCVAPMIKTRATSQRKPYSDQGFILFMRISRGRRAGIKQDAATSSHGSATMKQRNGQR